MARVGLEGLGWRSSVITLASSQLGDPAIFLEFQCLFAAFGRE